MGTEQLITPKSLLEPLKFSHIVYAFAVAYALHIVEEFPRLITWTNGYPEIDGGEMTAAIFCAGDALFMT